MASGSRVRGDSPGSRRIDAPGARAFLARGRPRREAGGRDMKGKAIWTGSIAFGLVNIPIQLHRAVRETRPRFRLLHAKDKSPVRFERVCLRDGKPVAWGDLVKGYEYEKGKFVALTREDMQAAALEK